ncbi:hypothetical protein [Myxococcus vastator]|uniref:hypothetical protein n=1 Tax=Myxococcus vastator TaxID=2709664 RepID=UPI0013D874A9|nr:hypothetical protein [Myxococcus vastator]
MDLFRLRRRRPELRELTPAACFVWAVHVAAGAIEGAWGWQAPGYEWAEAAGYSRSQILRAFADLADCGLVWRYEQLRTIEFLTADLPQPLTEWTCRDGKEGRKYANVYSVSYLTPKGAALAEELELYEERAHRGVLTKVRTGLLARLERSLRPVLRAFARRRPDLLEKNATPHVLSRAVSQDTYSLEGGPTYPQANSRQEEWAEHAPNGACEVPEGPSTPLPPSRATHAGAERLSGGESLDRVRRQLVAYCLSRRVWEPVFEWVPAPCRCDKRFRGIREWEGFGHHQAQCPYASDSAAELQHLRQRGWRRVFRPVLTAAELWPKAWEAPERREELAALAQPILQEVWESLETTGLGKLLQRQRRPAEEWDLSRALAAFTTDVESRQPGADVAPDFASAVQEVISAALSTP